MDGETKLKFALGFFFGISMIALHIWEDKMNNTKKEHTGLLSIFTAILAVLFGFGGKK